MDVYNFTAQIVSGNALDMILFQPMNEGTAIIDGAGFRSKGKFVQDDIINVSIF